jgi:hypothetical protein
MAAIALVVAACAPSKDEKPAPAPAPAAGAVEGSPRISTSAAPMYQPPGLTPDELHGKVAKGEGVVIVDVRSEAAYEEAHIRGAKSIPWAKLPQGYKQLPKDRLIALYCT